MGRARTDDRGGERGDSWMGKEEEEMSHCLARSPSHIFFNEIK